MPEGLVQAIGTSRSGKPTVTIDGQIYSASKIDTSTLQVGDKISFDSASSVYNGVTIWFINGWALVEPAKKYPITPTGPAVPGSTPKPSPTVGLSEGERLTMSNWVGQAIASGKVDGPADLSAWARAAVNATRAAADPDFIPF